ncbi:expressed unknown protein [Seminavis robusta]|uniref:Uncharacterized protein n=1 Tax=Seminavis robusta TaxID=568900 RepID=A0A9N8DZR6_9STRA|nr:expressed unknown protein [Seminavis robusta]|eukprot:Sro371_g128590.1 n/a (261) ;mRNA; r:47256-48038
MPPLAKTFELQSGLDNNPHVGSTWSSYSKPPPLIASTSTGSNSTSTTVSSSTTSASNQSLGSSSSHSASRGRKSASLSAYHAVKSSLRAIVMFLEASGVATASVEELADMISQKQFLQVMDRAEEYVELLLSLSNADNQHDVIYLDALTMLFAAAWNKLVEYTGTNYQKARKEFARHENEQWQDFIGHQRLSEQAQDARNQRRMLQWDPQQRQKLIDSLNYWTRAKIDAEKGKILNQEWTRIMQRQRQSTTPKQQQKPSS